MVAVRGLGSSQNTPSRRRHRRPSSSFRNGGEEDGKSDDKNEDAEAAAAAVVNNADSGAETSPKKKKKKRSFGYDFREVFLKSNVPQLIATLSGRIVVCKYTRKLCFVLSVQMYLFLTNNRSCLARLYRE